MFSPAKPAMRSGRCWSGGAAGGVQRSAAAAAEPAVLAKYTFNLAKAFNLFYHRHRIIAEEDEVKRAVLITIADYARQQLIKALGTWEFQFRNECDIGEWYSAHVARALTAFGQMNLRSCTTWALSRIRAQRLARLLSIAFVQNSREGSALYR